MKPIVSVIVNTYNYGRYIEEAVESVLSQDFPKDQFEVLVVDDGSTDDTAERLKRFGSSIRYLYQQNQGQAQACNTGFRVSEGQVVCFLDSDDAWYPEKLRRVVNEFETNPCLDMVFHTLDIELDDGTRVGNTPINTYSEPVVRFTPESFLHSFYRVAAPTSGMAMRRSCLERIMPIPGTIRISADAYLQRAGAVWAREIALIRRPLGKYRKHGESHPFGQTSAQRVRTTLDVHYTVAEALKPMMQHSTPFSSTLQTFLEFEIRQLEIFALNLEGRRLKALKKALSLKPFPQRPSMLNTLEAKVAILFSAILPQRAFFRLKHWFRTVRPFQPAQVDFPA